MNHRAKLAQLDARVPDEVVARIPRRNRNGGEEELRVEVARYNGRPYVTVRIWYRSDDWCPGQGLRIRLEEVGAVSEAMNRVAAKLRDGGRA